MNRILSEANVDYVLEHLSTESNIIQLEYIEGTGSQYILTDYYANSNTTVETDIELTSTDHTSTIFSARSLTNSGTKCVVIHYLASGNFRGDWNNQQITFSNSLTGIIHISMAHAKTRIQDITHTYNEATFSSNEEPMMLFATKYNGSLTNKARIKMYYLTISENGVLINYLIPAKKNSEIGMYDIITGSFYSSETSTPFIAGPEVGIFSIPSEYRFTEYIDNGANGSYVNTNFKPDGNTRVVTRMKKNGNAAQTTFMFGGRGSNYNQALCALYIPNESAWRFDYGSGSSQKKFTNIAWNRDLYIDFDGNKSTPTLVFGQNTTTYSKQTFTSPSSLMIFGVGNNASETIDLKVNGRLYFMRLYRNGVLERNFWPVVRKSDKKIGIFDSVNKVFYPNYTDPVFANDDKKTSDIFEPSNNFVIQNGSNEKPATVDYVLKSFGKEPIEDERPFSQENLLYILKDNSTTVPQGYTKLLWAESTGNTSIDTGIHTNQNTRVVMKVVLRSVDAATVGGFFFGSCYPSIDNGIESYIYDANTATVRRVYAVHNNDYAFSDPQTVSINDTIDIDFNKNHATIKSNGTLILDKTFTPKTYTSSQTLKLFSLSRQANYFGMVRIYYCKIYDNDTLIRDFVPCLNSEGNAGMYDTVTGAFFQPSNNYFLIAGPKL